MSDINYKLFIVTSNNDFIMVKGQSCQSCLKRKISPLIWHSISVGEVKYLQKEFGIKCVTITCECKKTEYIEYI